MLPSLLGSCCRLYNVNSVDDALLAVARKHLLRRLIHFKTNPNFWSFKRKCVSCVQIIYQMTVDCCVSCRGGTGDKGGWRRYFGSAPSRDDKRLDAFLLCCSAVDSWLLCVTSLLCVHAKLCEDIFKSMAEGFANISKVEFPPKWCATTSVAISISTFGLSLIHHVGVVSLNVQFS